MTVSIMPTAVIPAGAMLVHTYGHYEQYGIVAVYRARVDVPIGHLWREHAQITGYANPDHTGYWKHMVASPQFSYESVRAFEQALFADERWFEKVDYHELHLDDDARLDRYPARTEEPARAHTL